MRRSCCDARAPASRHGSAESQMITDDAEGIPPAFDQSDKKLFPLTVELDAAFRNANEGK